MGGDVCSLSSLCPPLLYLQVSHSSQVTLTYRFSARGQIVLANTQVLPKGSTQLHFTYSSIAFYFTSEEITPPARRNNKKSMLSFVKHTQTHTLSWTHTLTHTKRESEGGETMEGGLPWLEREQREKIPARVSSSEISVNLDSSIVATESSAHTQYLKPFLQRKGCYMYEQHF